MNQGQPFDDLLHHWASEVQQLGQFEAGVARDGVSEFVTQSALLLVVGQLQQVEARRRRWQSTDGVLASDVEEPFQHTTNRVTSVLYIHKNSAIGTRRNC